MPPEAAVACGNACTQDLSYKFFTCSLLCLALPDVLLACVQLQGRKGQGAQRPPRGVPGHNVYPGSVPRSQARGTKRWAARCLRVPASWVAPSAGTMQLLEALPALHSFKG